MGPEVTRQRLEQIVLMVAPHVLGYAGSAAAADRIAGPLVATFALVAVWEATRGVRWINVAAAVLLVVAPVVLRYDLLPAGWRRNDPSSFGSCKDAFLANLALEALHYLSNAGPRPGPKVTFET